jgi:hypothetical protein
MTATPVVRSAQIAVIARRLVETLGSTLSGSSRGSLLIDRHGGKAEVVAIGPAAEFAHRRSPPEATSGDIRIGTTSSLWSARISASKPYVVGCYGPVALDNRWKRASLITSDSALSELVGYVEATRRAACRFALKEVWKGIETKCPAADQAISFMRFVAHKFTRFCLHGYIKHDMRSGSRLRQDTRPDFTDHRYRIWQLQLQLRRLRRNRSRVRLHHGRGLLLCRMVV